MSDPDPDTEVARQTDPRYDNWPVERYEGYADWSVERAMPQDEGGTHEQVAEEYEKELEKEGVEWLGFAGPGTQVGSPFLYTGSAIYEGEIDQENERIILRHASRREVGSEESLGKHLKDIGEEHDWKWLSSFARRYLTDDEAEVAFELRHSEFNRRGLPEPASYDFAFTGSHTLVDDSERRHIIDRSFNVDVAEPDRVSVDVDDSYLVAKEPDEDRRAGDAELVEKRQFSFDVEIDEDTPNRETEIEKHLKEWHSTHVGWPTRE